MQVSAQSLPELTAALDRASRSGPRALADTFPASAIVSLLDRLKGVLEAQPSLVEVWSSLPELPLQLLGGARIASGVQVLPGPEDSVTVVGDTHGQYHDVVTL